MVTSAQNEILGYLILFLTELASILIHCGVSLSKKCYEYYYVDRLEHAHLQVPKGLLHCLLLSAVWHWEQMMLKDGIHIGLQLVQ